MISKHPAPDMIVEYTSGTLAAAPAISITTHLQFCDTCRQLSDSLNDVGGKLLDDAQPVDVSEGLLDSVMACLDKPVASIPAPAVEPDVTDEVTQSLPAYVQKLLPRGELDWRFLSPSIKTSQISVGEQTYELALHRIKAGGMAPEHDHRGREITVVLTGSFSDEDGHYHPGDFIVREVGDIHRPLATQNAECICLSVLEAPIRLTGLKQIFNPFMRFSPS